MTQLTITEALAEIKTIGKRLEKKRGFIAGALYRSEAFKDPHEKDGGSEAVIARERQAILDLEERSISLRRAISAANDTNLIEVGGVKRTIHWWLIWRREVAPGQQAFLKTMAQAIEKVRRDAHSKQFNVNPTGETKPTDIRVYVDEKKLHEEIEQIETTMGDLDGQLSLKNATISVTVA